MGTLADPNPSGTIIYADDAYVNRQTLRLMTIQEIGLDENLTTCANGK